MINRKDITVDEWYDASGVYRIIRSRLRVEDTIRVTRYLGYNQHLQLTASDGIAAVVRLLYGDIEDMLTETLDAPEREKRAIYETILERIKELRSGT